MLICVIILVIALTFLTFCNSLILNIPLNRNSEAIFPYVPMIYIIIIMYNTSMFIINYITPLYFFEELYDFYKEIKRKKKAKKNILLHLQLYVFCSFLEKQRSI